MLLDDIFEKGIPKEIIVVRKNGSTSYISRPIDQTDNTLTTKPLFPISKERQ
jgi:hypothetical protein